MILRRRSAPQILNPYIVFADVAIALMMMVMMMNIISASLAEATYQADYERILGKSMTLGLSSDWRKKPPPRVSNELYFQFDPNGIVIDPSMSGGTGSPYLTDIGKNKLKSIADLINDPSCNPLIHSIDIDLTYSAHGPRPHDVQTDAELLKDELTNAQNHVDVHMITTSGRIQDVPPDAGASKSAVEHENADVDKIVICVYLDSYQ
jgi:hypothetical protein